MRPRYEEMLTYLREWQNPRDEPGPYDGNGLVHLLLAILDNLRANEPWADLPEIADSMTAEQAAFFLKLAGYVAGGNVVWPTFGQLQDYLRGHGFRVDSGRPGYVVCAHPEGCEFVFRDREPDCPAQERELVNVRLQLDYRGFVTEEEFARFWNLRIRLPS